jgi:hypothetical protein
MSSSRLFAQDKEWHAIHKMNYQDRGIAVINQESFKALSVTDLLGGFRQFLPTGHVSPANDKNRHHPICFNS